MILTPMLGLLLVAPLQQSDEALKALAKSALDATGFQYTTTTSGKNYAVIFDHPENRKQTVYMNATPAKPGKLVTYTLYTQVWAGKEAPDEALMRKILGRTKKFGAFYLFKDPQNMWAIRFNVKFDATDMPATPQAHDTLIKSLKDAFYFVNAVGEETDRELNGKRDMP